MRLVHRGEATAEEGGGKTERRGRERERGRGEFQRGHHSGSGSNGVREGGLNRGLCRWNLEVSGCREAGDEGGEDAGHRL